MTAAVFIASVSVSMAWLMAFAFFGWNGVDAVLARELDQEFAEDGLFAGSQAVEAGGIVWVGELREQREAALSGTRDAEQPVAPVTLLGVGLDPGSGLSLASSFVYDLGDGCAGQSEVIGPLAWR